VNGTATSSGSSKAIQDAGITPVLGGLEFAAELVQAMDLSRLERRDVSLGRLVQDLREQLNQWEQG
jgi:hypothetical protein